LFLRKGQELIAVNLPRITVVTPSYNQGRYLDQTIRSVLDQGYPNLEYIICDGGSTDDSVDVIKRYESRLAWWSSAKDKGQTDALNKGFSRATGELYTYINSDDTLYPGSLMAAARAFAEGKQWITGWAMFLEPDGGEWPQLPEAWQRRIDWFHCNPISQQGTFWSAKFTRELGGFREDMHFGFDYEFWMRIIFKAGVMPHLLRKCMGGYRLHEASKTMSQYEKFRVEFRQLRAAYWNCLTPEEQDLARSKRRRWESEQHRLQAWTAIKAGDIETAREEAREAFRKNRLSVDSWKLMYCVLRGR
jgi:glycosyltransferase involved in cell wall biosynthesis